MIARQKIQPFLNNGFNYKDRRHQAVLTSANPEEISRRRQLAVRYKAKIDKYRRRLENAIGQKDVFEIEKILNDIMNNEEECELWHHLRLEIIQAQLCMKAYYKWRAETREYTA